MEITFYLSLRCMADEYMDEIIGIAKSPHVAMNASNSYIRVTTPAMLYNRSTFTSPSADSITL